MGKNIKSTLILMLILVGISLVSGLIGYILGGNLEEHIQLISVFSRWFVVFWHCIKRYGIKNTLVLFGLTFLISWSTETLSIAMGFPFGNYYYTDVLGAKLGTVPWVIMEQYFVTGYLAWSIGANFLQYFGTTMKKRDLVLLPVLAGFIMVMWDFCFDPIFANILGTWVWEDGGYYWGVPLTNYFGWYLTIYLIYQLFAIYLYKFGKEKEIITAKTFWYIPTILYLGISFEYLVVPFTKTEFLDIYWSMFLAATMTMVFVSLLSFVLLSRTSISNLKKSE